MPRETLEFSSACLNDLGAFPPLVREAVEHKVDMLIRLLKVRR